MAEKAGFRHGQPKPNRAKRLAGEALTLTCQGRFAEAVPCIEKAIRCDQVGGLNPYSSLRRHIYTMLGDQKPQMAAQFYSHAILCKRQGRYRDAKVAYLEAFALDQFFLWSANNYA
jgi:hypothetical protein